ncbi:MAG: hypothetical protein MJE77_37830 [Proteobacteria bacterium]|nr:hypothetical protein [Pseudomonadota bacterium]
MSRIKYAAATAFAAFVETAAPELAGNVTPIQAPPQTPATYPTAAVLPGRFTVEWASSHNDVLDTNGEAVTDGSGNALVNVGRLAGTLQLWIAAEYPTHREDIEGKLLAAFVGVEDVGAVTITVDSALYAPDTGRTSDATVYLNGEEWREEMVFSERRWAILDLDVEIPLDKIQAPIVDTLELVVTEDLTDVSGEATPEDALNVLEGEETFTVAQNGSYTEV